MTKKNLERQKKLLSKQQKVSLFTAVSDIFSTTGLLGLVAKLFPDKYRDQGFQQAAIEVFYFGTPSSSMKLSV